MDSGQEEISRQVDMIRQAMATAGVWSAEIPSWLNHHKSGDIPDIWQWLQYIYLPMRLNGQWYKPHYIAPVTGPYMDTTPELQNILQLVIELDAITPTIDKP